MKTNTYYELPDGIYYETNSRRILRALRYATESGKLTTRETSGKAGQLYLYLCKTFPYASKQFKESFVCAGNFCSSSYVVYCEGIGHVAYEHVFNRKTGRIKTTVIPLSAYASQAILPHKIIQRI